MSAGAQHNPIRSRNAQGMLHFPGQLRPSLPAWLQRAECQAGCSCPWSPDYPSDTACLSTRPNRTTHPCASRSA